MGHVYTKVKIGDPKREKIKEMVMLADTGSTYMCIPPQLAEELGLPIIEKRKVTVANKREVEAGVSFASVEIESREEIVRVTVFDISEPVVGAFTLEALGLAVDPASGKLKPTRSFITRA